MPKFPDDKPFQVIRVLTYTGDKLQILRALSKRNIKAQSSRHTVVTSEDGSYTMSESFNDGEDILRMLGEEVHGGVAVKNMDS